LRGPTISFFDLFAAAPNELCGHLLRDRARSVRTRLRLARIELGLGVDVFILSRALAAHVGYFMYVFTTSFLTIELALYLKAIAREAAVANSLRRCEKYTGPKQTGLQACGGWSFTVQAN
jgi:hypothetical protein